MSYQPLWLRDLAAYSIQSAVLVGIAAVLARALRLRLPMVRLVYWQGVLALCVLLPLLQPWRPEVLETSGNVMSSVIFFGAPQTAAGATSLSLAGMVLLLLCAGIALRAVWIALGLGRLWLYRRRAERIEQAPQPVAEAQRLVPVYPALFVSRELRTPATFGFFRPVILFPAGFLEMRPSMQKAVALHELLHVERRDWLWNLFEEITLTLLWFHIPLWWVARSARLSREQVVDAEAVRRSKARRPYLEALLEMARLKPLAESLPAALFLRESQLAERVALMMKEVQMSRRRITVSISAAAATLLMAGASLVWAFPLKTPAQPQTSPAVSSVAAGISLPENPPAAEANSGQRGPKIYKVGGDVQAPSPIYKPEPPYTRRARKNHLNGTAVFSVVIDAKGRVVSVKEGSRPLGQGLDEGAIKTIRSWKFRPAMRDGVPVPVRVMVEVTFKTFGKGGEVPHNPKSESDPPAQTERSAAGTGNQGSQVPAVPKIQVPQVPKINAAELQKQLAEIQKQAQEAANQAAEKLNSGELRGQIEQAMKQVKINKAEMQRQLAEAMKQAKIAQQEAEKVRMRKEEIQKQIARATEQLQAAQQQLLKAQQQMEKQGTEIKPPSPPPPASGSPKEAPSPVPPPLPQSR